MKSSRVESWFVINTFCACCASLEEQEDGWPEGLRGGGPGRCNGKGNANVDERTTTLAQKNSIL